VTGNQQKKKEKQKDIRSSLHDQVYKGKGIHDKNIRGRARLAKTDWSGTRVASLSLGGNYQEPTRGKKGLRTKNPKGDSGPLDTIPRLGGGGELGWARFTERTPRMDSG